MPRAFKDNKPGVFEIEGDLNSCLDFGKKKCLPISKQCLFCISEQTPAYAQKQQTSTRLNNRSKKKSHVSSMIHGSLMIKYLDELSLV